MGAGRDFAEFGVVGFENSGTECFLDGLVVVEVATDDFAVADT